MTGRACLEFPAMSADAHMYLSASLAALHEWRLAGATQKAESVIQLTQGLKVDSVLEIGAGTGAVLEMLDRRGFARRYYAVEPSAELCNFISDLTTVERLVAVDAHRIEDSKLRHRRYDLVVLSHVLEHVEEPEPLLRAALELGAHVVAEVPLEGTLGANIRAVAKSVLTRRPRWQNPAGHIHFYSRRSFDALVASAGGVVLRRRVYVPHESMAIARGRSQRQRDAIASRVVQQLGRMAGDTLWSAVYHGHYAVLARPAA